MDDPLPFANRAGRTSASNQTRVTAGTRRRCADPGRADGIKRVLVLSHMFPSAAQPALGPFVLEQVRALRRHCGLDARVVCGRPFWVNSRNPFRYYPALRLYRRELAQIRWQAWEDVPVMNVPYLVGDAFPFWVHGKTYQEAILGAAPRICKKFPFQAIHAHTSYLDGTAGLALSQMVNVPLLITEHTSPFSSLTDDKRIRRLTLGAIQGADQVWCVSSSLAEEMKGYLPAGKANISILGNGVDTAQFRPPAEWTPDPARPRLVAVMSLEQRKNPVLALRALQGLRQSAPGATLTLVGAGPQEALIRETVAALNLGPAVRLFGPASRQGVAQLMREECDLVMLTSNHETFGVVLIEALACGKPVVATACGGPADIVREPWLGRLCVPENEQALVEALVAVCHALPKLDGGRIRQYALAHFDYRQLAKALYSGYDRHLALRQASGASRRQAA
jgi:glycosyltransferase involved in cell wall biosynthesis